MQIFSNMLRVYVRGVLSVLLVLVCAMPALDAQQREGSTSGLQFRFEQREGDRYRIVGEIEQDVFINGVYSHSARILNRIASEVVSADADGADIVSTFVLSEQAIQSGRVYEWGREYESEFYRSALGVYDISDEYYMPVVRDVPVFPERSLSPGETWSAPGHEAHDLRVPFGIEDAFRFPMPVNYEYRGPTGEGLHEIGIRYNVFFRPSQRYNAPVYPVMITGYADQTLFWSADEGLPDSYEEEYVFVFFMNDGSSVRYEGTADAEVIEAERLNRAEVVEDIQRDLEELGLEDDSVREDDRGVTISLNTIQFPPDSARLMDTEREKLREIAPILQRYPDNDILITGHTALAGSEEHRQQLSDARARVVGEYLLELGIRDPGRITFQGMGAREPVAPNDTEAQRRLNRRVEITILDN